MPNILINILSLSLSVSLCLSVSLSVSLSLSLDCEPVWSSGKALGWQAEGPRFESASALLSLQKLWSVDIVLWFTKDESGNTILYALKLCKFVIRKASQKV